MRSWLWQEQQGALFPRQLWGALTVQGHQRVQVALQKRRSPDLVGRVNAHIATLLDQVTYTAVALIHGVDGHPMLVHTHPNDDSLYAAEIALGDFLGGVLFTSALLCAKPPCRAA